MARSHDGSGSGDSPSDLLLEDGQTGHQLVHLSLNSTRQPVFRRRFGHKSSWFALPGAGSYIICTHYLCCLAPPWPSRAGAPHPPSGAASALDPTPGPAAHRPCLAAAAGVVNAPSGGSEPGRWPPCGASAGPRCDYGPAAAGIWPYALLCL